MTATHNTNKTLTKTQITATNNIALILTKTQMTATFKTINI